MSHDADFQELATQLVEAQRLESRVVLGEAIDALKGDAVGRGRLRSGFFVRDLIKLCERHLQRRGNDIIAAYESALVSCRPTISVEVSTAVRQGVRDQVRSEASEIEETFQRSLLRDHLPVVDPFADATNRVETELDARVRLLLAQFGNSTSTAVTPSTTAILPSSADEIVEIRPNFAGIGINVRALLRKVSAWWAERRGTKST